MKRSKLEYTLAATSAKLRRVTAERDAAVWCINMFLHLLKQRETITANAMRGGLKHLKVVNVSVSRRKSKG